MNRENDSSISEINILPDGRVCIFGASQQVLEALDAMQLGDPSLSTRIDALRSVGERAAATHEASILRNE
ncbi:MAG: hypothetical protein GX594_10725 [Pirellulaceae bacterium]|mgnify:CR=1 FL=1|nr:hypothetical protein [Pirellulaceae bacterium]